MSKKTTTADVKKSFGDKKSNGEMVIQTQDKDGDIRYLAEARATMAGIGKILGIDAPVPVKVDWQIEIVNLLRDSRITVQDVIDEFGDVNQVRALLKSAGVITIEGRATEVESSNQKLISD